MKRTLSKLICKLPGFKGRIEKRPRVSVVRLTGVITASSSGGASRMSTISFGSFEQLLEQAYEVPGINAVAVIINSPGGSPAQSALIAGKIRELSKKHSVKTFAFVEDIAASGGYWLACAADKIYAQPSSILGSIGVVSAGFGLDGLIKKHGIDRRVYTAGDSKTMLDPFQPEKPADVKRLKAIQKQLHTQFIDWVKSRRGKKLNGTDKKLFNGDIWLGDTAIELGLCDAIGEMRATMRKEYGEKTKFIMFQQQRGFLSSLMSGRMAVSLDGAVQDVEHDLLWSRFSLR